MHPKDFALYVHIPYCRHKCPYCDFNTYAVSKVPEFEYSQALLNEYKFRLETSDWQESQIKSIYFGGGTPTVFSANTLQDLLTFFSDRSKANIEITVEANPEGIASQYLSELKKTGVNRISFGAQSFLAEQLRILGRTHSSQDIHNALIQSRQVGIDNINLDLIYGIPEQTLESLNLDLDYYINTSPNHISAYNLTIEPGTTFHQRLHAGSISIPDDERVVAMYNLVNSRLTEAGFYQYEISNYAKPGFESKHNLAYWQRSSYLGLGAGAHSLALCSGIFGRRWCNLAKPESYIEAVRKQGGAEAWTESMNRESAMFEFLFLGLRLNAGIKISQFNNTFAVDLLTIYQQEVNDLVRSNLANLEADRLVLTQKGFLLSDSIFELFTKSAMVS